MRILTGMQASGIPHWGNYFGMMRSSIDLQKDPANECFYFVADLHAFTSRPSADKFRENQERVTLDWLSLGLDPDRSVFYRQSDVPAHTELAWYLLCLTPMGMLERAHSYKDKKANGIDANAGLFTYPVLMAADILLYDAEKIPVGKDQKQHVEMARDLAQKFNHFYGETFVLPEPEIRTEVQTILGIDGRKMSKSYGNTIDIFEEEKTLKKKIMSIPTASLKLGDPIDPDTCTIMAFHRLFENPEVPQLEQQYRSGEIGFGESKKRLFEFVWEYFAPARERRTFFLSNKKIVQEIMEKGAQKAQERAEKKLKKVRERVGL